MKYMIIISSNMQKSGDYGKRGIGHVYSITRTVLLSILHKLVIKPSIEHISICDGNIAENRFYMFPS